MSASRQDRRQLYERLVGSTVADKYDIVSLMGFGGMGAVYEAVQRNMNRRVALKYIPSHDPVTAARFEREALTVSQLRHPNTVTVFDYGQTHDGFLFLSMELLHGRTLTELITQNSPLTPARAVYIASQICRSLAEAHQNGIVHRDIKPDNIILIEVDGDPDVVKVLDFGIAKAVSGEEEVTLTGDGRIIGTPRYMSPEQILGESIDHRSDIYSLGCIIFEMLCGAPPFEAPTTTALMMSHAQDPPPPFAERLPPHYVDAIPLGLEHVVRRAMAKAPTQRPQTTDELRKELEKALDAHRMGRPANVQVPPAIHAPAAIGSSEAAPAAPPIDSSGRGFDRSLLIAATGIVFLALSLVAAAFVVLNSDDDDDDDIPQGLLDDAVAEHQLDDSIQSDALPPSQRQDTSLEPKVEVELQETVHLRIDSQPSEAEIVDGDHPLGTTPFNLVVPSDTGTLEYELVARGYRDKTIALDINPGLGDSQEHTFTLERRRPTRPAQPSPPPQESSGPQIELLGGGDDDDDDAPFIPTL